MSDIGEQFRRVQESVQSAAIKSGRDPDSVQLVAVSKTFPVTAIQAAYDAGARVFGESRHQELAAKIPELTEDIEWHFIGKLQSNKARRVGEAVRMIHTIESESQIRELTKLEKDRKIEVLIEVNTSKESQKSGIFPEALDKFVEMVLNGGQVHLRGLMTIGPVSVDERETRECFRELNRLLEKIPGGDVLSMGMSQDYEWAIQEGATHVRIGSAIFGGRA